jgi:ribonuclease PH
MATKFDRFRINGPSSGSYTPLAKEEIKDIIMKHDQDIDLKKKQIRPIFMKIGLLTKSNGSAYFETGKTKIIVSVMGPRQGKKRFLDLESAERAKLNVEFKFSTFACHERRGFLKVFH